MIFLGGFDVEIQQTNIRNSKVAQRAVGGVLNKTNFTNVPSANYLVHYRVGISGCAIETCILYPMSLPIKLSSDGCFKLLPERCYQGPLVLFTKCRKSITL